MLAPLTRSVRGCCATLRKNGNLTWQFNDQVNSTTITANADGSLASEVKYSAFGEIRFTNGATVSDNKYTLQKHPGQAGQRQEVEIGLYFYNARYYDSSLAHFVQADTLIPNAGSIKDYDRYAYVSNNPIKYNDPTGHESFL